MIDGSILGEKLSAQHHVVCEGAAKYGFRRGCSSSLSTNSWTLASQGGMIVAQSALKSAYS